MNQIRIVVVDDQTLIREGLASLLELMPTLTVVGKASEGREALKLVETLKPDVVLMDVRMPGMNGIAATRQMCEISSQTRVIILTTFDDDAYLFEALQAGAVGYLLKNADPDRLAEAVHSVFEGNFFLDPAVTEKVIRRMTRLSAGQVSEPVFTERLTSREREVLCLMASGTENGKIAERLSLAHGTVKNLVSGILGKLGARDRAHAVRLAIEWGLLADNA